MFASGKRALKGPTFDKNQHLTFPSFEYFLERVAKSPPLLKCNPL